MKFCDTATIGACTRLLFLMLAALAPLLADLTMVAPSEAATKRGGVETDSLTGTPRADTLLGLGGDDTLSGKAGPDRLAGGPGADRLNGGAGADKMHGGVGNDRLLARDGTADTVNCGSGAGDVATVDAVDRVSDSCEQVDRLAPERLPASVPSPAAAPRQPSAAPEPPPADGPPAAEDPEIEFEERPLAMFPAGHGWTGNGVGTFADVGPPLIVNNDRSYGITTNGEGDQSIATSPPLDPVDLTGSHVTMQAQVSFSARLDTVKLRLASGNIATDYAEATVWREDLDPIILGSSFEFQSLPIGAFDVVGDVDWSKIDRAQIVLTDSETGPVALYVAGIYAVPSSQRATISFAFDDGYESAFDTGMRKLSAYRYPASAYVIADIVGDPGMLDLEQLRDLQGLHHWEIAGHALTLASHNLPNGLDDLAPEALKAELNGLRDWLDENGFGQATFAYPKGAADQQVRQLVGRDYCAGRATARGPETIPPRDNYTIRGWSVNGANTDVEEIEAAIDNAAAEGTWLVLSFHDLVAGEPNEATEFNASGFAEIVDHVRQLQKEGDLRVRTVAGALGSLC